MSPITEAELLADSEEYFKELVANARLGSESPRVCHHFFPLDGARRDAYLPLLPRLIARIDPTVLMDVFGDPIGIEVWNLIEPDAAQLDQRIRSFHAAACWCSAVYAGWSYEPLRSVTVRPH